MDRRTYLKLTGIAVAAGVVGPAFARAVAAAAAPTDGRPAGALSSVAAFAAARRHAETPFGRIAYVEAGRGPAALFLHGAPLSGLHWRGAMERLQPWRRCIAPDFMGLGYSEVPASQALAAQDQVAMLVALLDVLGEAVVDVVASDSGGMVAQWLLARHPQRVRSLLLTNCDVEPDSPPAKVMPVIEMARAGTLAQATAQWLVDPEMARSTFGASVFHDPAHLSDELVRYYASPLVASPLRRRQYEAFHIALAPNPLAGVEAALRRSQVPVRIVWGSADDIFKPADAQYLDQLFPRSQGVRWLPQGKLFFAEEFPEVVAEEALALWRVATPTGH